MKGLVSFSLLCLVLLFSGVVVNAAPTDITWTEGTGNPVLSQTSVGSGRFYYGHVLYDSFAGKYRAWADASSSNDITYAETTGDNPAAWGGYTKCNLAPHARGKAHVVQLGANSFRMWHTGEDGTPGYEVYTYTGSDGINWSEGVLITGVADTAGATVFNDGPREHFAPTADGKGGFVCLCSTTEFQEGSNAVRMLNWYTSTDGVAWTWSHNTGIEGYDISSLVRHPHREKTWYAFGYVNGEFPCVSFESTDDGVTWTLSEEPMPVVGETGLYPYNPDRNYNPIGIYRGAVGQLGQWVFFRSTSNSAATPVHTTSYATGVETGITPSTVQNWDLY